MKKKLLSLILALTATISGSVTALTASAAQLSEISGAAVTVEESGRLPRVESGNYTYSILKDGTILLRGISSPETNDIAIPAEIDGKAVTMLSGSFTFKSAFTMGSVSENRIVNYFIPDTIKHIEYGAFSSYTSYNYLSDYHSMVVSIEIDENNESYIIDNDALFTKDHGNQFLKSCHTILFF